MHDLDSIIRQTNIRTRYWHWYRWWLWWSNAVMANVEAICDMPIHCPWCWIADRVTCKAFNFSHLQSWQTEMPSLDAHVQMGGLQGTSED